MEWLQARHHCPSGCRFRPGCLPLSLVESGLLPDYIAGVFIRLLLSLALVISALIIPGFAHSATGAPAKKEIGTGGKKCALKKKAKCSKVKQKNVVFHGNASKGNFTESTLKQADFNGAVLSKSNFSMAQLKSSTFRAVEMFRGKLNQAKLNSADFTGAVLDGVKMSQAKAKNGRFVGADLGWDDFGATSDLTGADFTGAVMTAAWLNNADATGAVFDQANLRGAALSSTTLQSASLVGANLNAVTMICFVDAEIDEDGCAGRTNLVDADLSGAKFKGAQIWSADFTGANLSGADFRGAAFDDGQDSEFREEAIFTDAIFCNTTMPDGSINNSGC